MYEVETDWSGPNTQIFENGKLMEYVRKVAIIIKGDGSGPELEITRFKQDETGQLVIKYKDDPARACIQSETIITTDFKITVINN